jgi:hypothetical protein
VGAEIQINQIVAAYDLETSDRDRKQSDKHDRTKSKQGESVNIQHKPLLQSHVQRRRFTTRAYGRLYEATGKGNMFGP